MNQFDIQMAILGPRVAAQIREFNDKNVKTIDFGELTDNIPEAQLMDIYQRIQKAIEKVGYSFSERSREEDFYLRTRSGMNGYTATSLFQKDVVIDKAMPLEARVGTALHEFAHAASYPSGTEMPNTPFDYFLPLGPDHPQVYNEILADVSAYLVAGELGLTSYAKRAVAYLGLHRILPEWVEAKKEQIYKNATFMREQLGLGEAALPAAA